MIISKIGTVCPSNNTDMKVHHVSSDNTANTANTTDYDNATKTGNPNSTLNSTASKTQMSSMSPNIKAEPQRGCMKVATLAESLASCNSRHSRHSRHSPRNNDSGIKRKSTLTASIETIRMTMRGSAPPRFSYSRDSMTKNAPAGVNGLDVLDGQQGRQGRSRHTMFAGTGGAEGHTSMRDMSDMSPIFKEDSNEPILSSPSSSSHHRRWSAIGTIGTGGLKHLHFGDLFHPHGIGSSKSRDDSHASGDSRDGLDEQRHDNDPQDAEATNKPTVRFDQVSIREYEVTASDNPAVSAGVALELGWKYSPLSLIPLEEFESHRLETRSTDFLKEKKILRHERERILREFGATQKDIMEAAKRAAIIRNKRRKSIAQRKRDGVHEFLEGVVDKIKDKLSGDGRGGRRRGALGCLRSTQVISCEEIHLHPSVFLNAKDQSIRNSICTQGTLDSSSNREGIHLSQ